MKTRVFALVGTTVLATTALLVAQEPSQPKQSGLIEETKRRLVQIDVSVSGPPEVITDLTRDDFLLSINTRKVTNFTLDNICRVEVKPKQRASEVVTDTPVEPAPEAPSIEPPRRRSTYMFYFDQRQLTLPGRQRALDMARDLMDDMIVDGNRAMVVSAGRELKTFSDLTDDPERLKAAVDAVQADRMQWDPTIVFASEETRREQIIDALNDGDQEQALGLARQYQREEAWQTGRTLRMFSLVLGRLVDVDSPKAVVYFADTMRKEAGRHYMSFFGRLPVEENPDLAAMDLDSFAAGGAYERVVEEAAAHGIRLYTIQAEGLVTISPRETITQSARAGQSSPTMNTAHVREAQNSLVGFAQESGGRAFLNGVASGKVARTIEEDLACVYLVSFDAEDFPMNQQLPVSVRVTRPKVTAHSRGRLVIQSDSRRRESKLLAAFASSETSASASRLSSVLIPTGFENGRFQALVQLSVPGSPFSATTWDMGMSLVSRGKVREDASGRVRVGAPGVRVIFETQMSFSPGPYELITVAHDTTADEVSTARLDGAWPDPGSAPATVGPLALIQPATGVFLRDEQTRRQGSRALADNEVARTDRPTAIFGIVCRNKGGHNEVRVERSLVGDSTAEFAPQKLDLSDDRCALFSDMIPADTMTTGEFEYRVEVRHEGELLAESSRPLFAASPDEHPELAGLSTK